MSAPRESALRQIPRGVTDSLDGDNSPQGSMTSLSNLIFEPSTPGVFACRPANTKISTFTGFTSPGIVSVAFSLNGIIYGMIASGAPSGKDRPFAYNVSTSAFETITGVTSANCPTTPASAGDWTPPTMDSVGSRIIVTHPGFNFSGGYAFGYFDLSGFSANIVGDTVSGSPIIHGGYSISGIGPGYTITGTGISANTTILNVNNVNFSIVGDTHSNTTIDNIVGGTSALYVGQTIAGLGIATGAVISSITSGSAIAISIAATATASGITLSIGGQEITMSANATGTNNAEMIAIAGGTATSPLWAAGNTTGVTQLAGIPEAVRQFNNRAYFGQGNNLVFTDTLSLNISNASGVQVLTIGDTSVITALMGLPEYTSSSGVLQALIVFKAFSIWQITGDIATSDLALNNLIGTVGTSAPRSVCITPEGINFMAVDGIRNVTLVGEVSEINADLAIPFIYAEHPSRVSACFNSDMYRICTQNSNVLNAPYQEYHFNYKYDAWTGPHTFRHDMAVAFSNDFIEFNNALPATMWKAYAVQNHLSEGATFIENGAQLGWIYQTVPMTSLGNLYTNAAIRSTLDLALPSTGDTYLFQGIDTNGGVVAQASIITPLNEAIWDAFDWGDGTLWGAAQFGLEPITIPWTQPLIFNKLVFQGSGNSSLGLKMGALFTGYEPLGYMKQ